MNYHPTVQAVYQRIVAIGWEVPDESKCVLHVPLMEEYLRRSGLWAKALNCDQVFPSFDVGLRIDPSVRADPDLVAALDAHLGQYITSKRMRLTCEWALHWAELCTLGKVQDFHLPDSYEPLLRMYELSGEFSVTTGFIEVDGVGISSLTWLELSEKPPFWTEPAE